MSTNNKIKTKFEISKTELEEKLKMIPDEYKSETSIYIDIKLLTLNSNKYRSSYDQPSVDLIRWTLLKSTEKYPHESQFTTDLSLMAIEGNTFLKIQKLWDAFLSAFFQTLSNNKSCPLYKYLISKHYNIYYFILPPDTYPKFSTTKEKYEAFSRALRVHLVKHKTISSSKAPK